MLKGLMVSSTSERLISLATLLLLNVTIQSTAAASLVASSRSVSAGTNIQSIPSLFYFAAAGCRPRPRAPCAAAFRVVRSRNHKRVNRRTDVRSSCFRAPRIHRQPSHHNLVSLSSASCVGVTSAAASLGWGLQETIGTRTNRGSNRLFSSHSPLVPPSQSDDDDLLKWERMYGQGGTNVFGDEDETGGDDPGSPINRSEVRVVTFDLDNTLWKTSDTIGAANDALYEFIENRGLSQPQRVEKVMGDLFRADGDRYCPGSVPKVNGDAGSGGATTKKSPVLLTQLRTDAIRKICVEHNGFTDEDADAFALEAFQVWTDARHMAIPDHYATSVVSCLREVRGITTSSGHPVVVGAVTDGNSDPRNVPDLRDMFDFCVNSERVGVSKPDGRVYRAAIEEAARFPALEEVLGLRDNDEERASNDYVVEDLVGPWWVHVGDDFLKDVVPAKELRMRTVFATELVTKKEDADKAAPQKETDEQSKTRDVSDLVKDLSSMKVIEMTIGADDFLVESMQSEFVDAKIESFHELSKVITKWHSEALRVETPDGGSLGDVKQAKGADVLLDQDIPDVLTVVYPDKKEGPADATSDTTNLVDMESSESKFCVFCGTKNPNVARFCLSCGKQQPEVT